MHLKRQKVPKSWPVYRKGTKYVVRPSSNLREGLPLLVVLRDMLKVAQNRKEAKRAIFLKKILLNKKIPRSERSSVVLFDNISIVPSKEDYRLELSDKGKFELTPIKAEESKKKIAKVIDKKILKGKRAQLNFRDGRNLLSDIKANVNDSVVINLEEKKIEKTLPLKEGARAFIFAGKHAGKKGAINSIDSKNKRIELTTDKKEKINVLIRQIIVIE